MNAVAFVDGEQVTHLHGEENWIEVSGFKADHSFYRKAVLACDGRVWQEVFFEYPTQSQEDISEFVSLKNMTAVTITNIGAITIITTDMRKLGTGITVAGGTTA
jgi:hypothetical protein